MAEHTRAKLRSTYCLAESGTAGPAGGMPGLDGQVARNRSPGYVALAVAVEGVEGKAREVETGSANREENMVGFAVEGLRLLRDVIGERAKAGEMGGKEAETAVSGSETEGGS